MRKTTILGLGLALALGASGAQAQQSTEKQKSPAGAEQRRGGEGRGRRGGPEGFLLRGITLTDAQKAQLRSLRSQGEPEDRARRQAAMQEIRALRQKGDTAGARARMEAVRADMTRQREQRTAAVRNILTAEQRVQFDRNVAEAATREADRAARGGEGRHGGRGGRGKHDGQGAAKRRG